MKSQDLSLDKLAHKTPAQERQEARKHRGALIRGRRLIALGLLMLALFGAITAAVLFLDPLALDVPITREVQDLNFGPFNWLLLAVSAPGFAPWNFIFPVVIILGLALFRRFAEAAFLLLASLAATLADLVKVLVHRGRPSADLVQVIGHPNTFSFPSGHVTQYVLFFGFSFYLTYTLMKPGLLRTLLLIFTAGMVLLVGPSRVWMGQHWASDVLGGYTLGFGLLLLVIWAYRGWEARRVKQVDRSQGRSADDKRQTMDSKA
jgi:membrane-associated phospholipid phosphatase